MNAVNEALERLRSGDDRFLKIPVSFSSLADALGLLTDHYVIAQGQEFSMALEDWAKLGVFDVRGQSPERDAWAKEYLKKRGSSPTSSESQKVRNKIPEKNSDLPLLDDKNRLNHARKFYTGVGTKQNYQKAYELFFPLAQSGNAEAARFGGLMNLSGKGTEKDLNLAKQWLSVASQKGDKIARRLLDSYQSLF